MRMRPAASRWIRWSPLGLVVLVLVGAVGLFSNETPPFNERDKAFYMDEAMVNFVRPGLVITVTGHEIAQDGTVKARFKLTDPRGLGLDRLGITTPGNISVSFILARIPTGKSQYEAYTVRTQTSPITGVSAVQASADSGGTFQQTGDGEYVYTFRTKLPAGYEANATHSIGAYGSRNLSEFDLGTNYADTVYNFVPNGSPVTVVRDLVADATCNGCHEQLAFHGGSRRTVANCNLCHTPQTVDPDTGESQDMKVLIHRIHAGSSLPSVQAGKPFIVIGNRQSVHDYSHIAYPADIRNCESCHKPGPKQADLWLTNPTRETCGSCHDNVNFATGEGHLNLPQISDNQCKNCHIPEGELEFDASIKGAHTIPTKSKMLPGINVQILSVENGKAGQRPVVRFKVTDNSGALIPVAQLNRLALVLAGPTTDYVSPGNTGYVAETVTAAAAQASGDHYVYQMATTIPANAKGSFSVGIESRRVNTILEGTQKQMSVQYGADNHVMHFSVDDSAVAPRRQIVTTEKCNVCHDNVAFHGANRNRVEQCILCHNPLTTDVARRPAAQAPAESINMALMIHRIHAGNQQTRDYTIYGFGNTPHNYNGIAFSAPLAACTMCHVGGSENVPVAAVADIVDPRGYMNPVKPATGACLGCHTSRDAAAHALANTSALGESCGVCHGDGKSAAVGKVHAR
ncbi:MAG: OmcA/MtrC family decaheme c-type cytochrome [Bryobacteraceae bacterium]|nr:OmcA/MtrC family decaheme c-type cytochrome [Solibacteraceae bacterium]MCO5349438.1 OmcA/MtrC family decaheme c-type cytochrome [Bryobacteraceae bacterium]